MWTPVFRQGRFYGLLWQETKKDAIVKRVSPGGWCDIPSLWKALDAGHNMLEVWAPGLAAVVGPHFAFVQKFVMFLHFLAVRDCQGQATNSFPYSSGLTLLLERELCYFG